jgi:hypothetical protein
MTQGIIAGVTRHILTAVGGIFAAKYAIDGTTMDAIIGGLTALIGVAWSIKDKQKAVQPLQ